MSDPFKRFEIFILRPLFAAYLIAAVIFLFKGTWAPLIGVVLGLFLLRVIGAKLRSLQSAAAGGPLEGPGARMDSDLLPPGVKLILVRKACTGISMLIAFMIGLVFWSVLGWRWYFTLGAMWLVLLFTVALLMLAFRVEGRKPQHVWREV